MPMVRQARHKADAQKISHLLAKSVDTVVEKDHLEAALRGAKKLRVKHGIDPTGDKIHIGRAVALWKLREFQELGHQIVLIIGDFTAQVGDPSDKLEKRPFLAKEDVARNMKNYLPQIGKIIDIKKAEVRYNSEWLGQLNFRETAELAESFSVNQMLRRRNFWERWEKEENISLREFLYPLMQGYDSVMVRADVELGGSDQLFNLLAGREIQKHYGQPPQDIMTTRMLSGLDGRKMSTSWGNVINITDSPDEQYGKMMSLHDDMIPEYFALATDVPERDIPTRANLPRKGAEVKAVKERLACEVVRRYHGAAAAEQAKEKWSKIFSEKDFSWVANLSGGGALVNLPEQKRAAEMTVKDSEVCDSMAKARQLIKGGGFRVNGVKVLDPKQVVELKRGDVVKIGKKYVARVGFK